MNASSPWIPPCTSFFPVKLAKDTRNRILTRGNLLRCMEAGEINQRPLSPQAFLHQKACWRGCHETSPKREMEFGWKQKVNVDGPWHPLVCCNPYGKLNFLLFPGCLLECKVYPWAIYWAVIYWEFWTSPFVIFVTDNTSLLCCGSLLRVQEMQTKASKANVANKW